MGKWLLRIETVCRATVLAAVAAWVLPSPSPRAAPAPDAVAAPAAPIPGRAEAPATPTAPAAAQATTPGDGPVAKQRAKVESLNAQLRAEHKRLDATIGRLVDIAVSLRDSRESGSMAVQIKEDAIEGLGKLVSFYRDELARVRQQAKAETSPAARAIWEEQIAQGTALVETRVDQIVRLTESLAVYAQGENHDGHGNITFSAANRADRVGDKVRDALRKDKERLEAENDGLRRDLGQVRDAEKRAEIEKQIAENDALIARRQEQFVGVVTGTAGSGRTAKRSTLFDYNQELRKISRELREGYEAVLKLKRTADKERRALALLEERQAGNQ